ncbi:MAG: hypothetical protein FJ271_14545 [Planctomycetes bacterium]|nr:hypothetical protein [Planctomycetota bacterium]
MTKCCSPVLVLVLSSSLPGAPAAPKSAPLSESAVKDMAGVLRKMIIQAMPPVLYEGQENWGRHSNTLDGITWRGKGGGIRAEIRRKPKNDGTWRKVRVTPRDLERTLAFDIRNWQNASAERITFNAILAFDAGVRFDQQIWESGVRLYAGFTRARFRVKLNLNCELLTRVETKKNSILPDFVFRLRVVKSDMKYDDLVVEHVGGIGGTAAKLLGEAMHKAVTRLRPDLERDMLAKANAAIVKAADTREVRLSLGGLLSAGSAVKQAPGSHK